MSSREARHRSLRGGRLYFAYGSLDARVVPAVASSNLQHCKRQANQGKRVLASSAMELQSLWMQVGWSLGQLSQNTPTLLLLT